LFAVGGSAALFADRSFGWTHPAPLPSDPPTTEAFWTAVREQFVMPQDFRFLNAANLCPSSGAVLEALYATTREMDREPSPAFRDKMHDAREVTRRALADFLRVTPEEIIITRNTSESNNLVSNGLDLRSGDEVLLFGDNHPSNLAAWQQKAKRFGYTVRIVEQVNPHPGPEHYIDAFARQMNDRTKVLACTHVTSTVGDLLPVKELCAIARQRGVLSLVDGAQSFGVLDVDLSDMQPDFYSGSAHKWPCGPKEVGVLYINTRAQAKIWPSIFSAYPGATGFSKTFESFGQRDEPAILAFVEALKLQTKIGRKAIELRARELASELIEGLSRIEGIKIWTSRDPQRRAAVVSFQPGILDVRKLTQALYDKERIVPATRTGADRGGLRLSPHLYNSHQEIERALAAIKSQLASGV
jgi:selenocysteine lyase/cysteine desulfurase